MHLTWYLFISDGDLCHRALPQCQVHLHGTRRSRHGPFNHISKSNHHWFRLDQLQAMPEKMEHGRQLHERSVPRIGSRKV